MFKDVVVVQVKVWCEVVDKICDVVVVVVCSVDVDVVFKQMKLDVFEVEVCLQKFKQVGSDFWLVLSVVFVEFCKVFDQVNKVVWEVLKGVGLKS